jgi:hypothetical protein
MIRFCRQVVLKIAILALCVGLGSPLISAGSSGEEKQANKQQQSEAAPSKSSRRVLMVKDPQTGKYRRATEQERQALAERRAKRSDEPREEAVPMPNPGIVVVRKTADGGEQSACVSSMEQAHEFFKKGEEARKKKQGGPHVK